MAAPDLDVAVMLEFFYVDNGIPRKVPNMPEQIITVRETWTMLMVRDWVWREEGIAGGILRRNGLNRIIDMFTSTYDEANDNIFMQFLTNLRNFRGTWWTQGYFNIFPKQKHWPWDPPKIYLLFDSGGPGQPLPDHLHHPEMIDVSRIQEAHVVRRRFQNAVPLIDDRIAALKPRTVSPFQPPGFPSEMVKTIQEKLAARELETNSYYTISQELLDAIFRPDPDKEETPTVQEEKTPTQKRPPSAGGKRSVEEEKPAEEGKVAVPSWAQVVRRGTE